jgi:hypothetical protein
MQTISISNSNIHAKYMAENKNTTWQSEHIKERANLKELGAGGSTMYAGIKIFNSLPRSLIILKN